MRVRGLSTFYLIYDNGSLWNDFSWYCTKIVKDETNYKGDGYQRLLQTTKHEEKIIKKISHTWLHIFPLFVQDFLSIRMKAE